MALLIEIRYSLTIAKFEQRVGRLGKNMRELTLTLGVYNTGLTNTNYSTRVSIFYTAVTQHIRGPLHTFPPEIFVPP